MRRVATRRATRVAVTIALAGALFLAAVSVALSEEKP